VLIFRNAAMPFFVVSRDGWLTLGIREAEGRRSYSAEGPSPAMRSRGDIKTPIPIFIRNN